MALTIDGTGSRAHRRRWTCQCDCGNLTSVTTNRIKSGETRSCGCLRNEVGGARLDAMDRAANATTHGFSKHPLYPVWINMIQRCENPDSTGYVNYGARGISVCERWHDVKTFCSDLGHIWFPGSEIHRIDRDGDYKPGNVEFIDGAEHRRIHGYERRNSLGQFAASRP